MDKFVLFAQPWWVNLLILVPVASFLWFRKGLALSKKQLLLTGLFGVAFGFVEAAVVVYLRAATGLLSPQVYPATVILNSLTHKLFVIEFIREAATIIMLLCIAAVAASKAKERWAMFLWVFAFWDIVYYLGLWLTIRWPGSLTTPDVLFLIPVPWLSQAWFPILVSGLTILIIALSSKKKYE